MIRRPRPPRRRGAARALLLTVAAATAVSAAPPCVAAPASAARPNVVLVMADDLGWGDVGFNGNRTIRTPHLDALAADGVRLTRFYAAAPVCSPTRGSCLTGRHPSRYGIPYANTGHLPPAELTLAELLKRRGYTTGHFGKWHLGTLTKTVTEANRGGPRGAQHFSPPQHNGFDVCFSTESKVPTWDPMVKPPDARRTYWDALAPGDARTPYNTHYWDEHGQRVDDGLDGSNARAIIDRALPFVRSAAAARRPFLAVIWFHTPHLPVVAGDEFRDLYPDAPSDYHRNYFGCITAMDAQVGRLRDDLATLGIAHNTMIAFCSDNGPEGGARDPGSAGGLRGRKRSLYEGGVRVPAAIAWPGKIPPGTTSDFPGCTSDYLPTVLAALGERPPQDRPIDGIDLLPGITGAAAARDSPIGFHSRGVTSWVGDRYKLIRAGGKAELYDLLDDPAERRDLADTMPDLARSMGEQMQGWRESCERSARGADYRDPLVRFGAIADCQYADADTRGARHYRLAARKLEDAVAALNGGPELAFTVHLGDFIDRAFESFDTVGPIFAKLECERYHVLGNHDYDVADERKHEVPRALGLQRRYYQFERGGVRFIVLDGNEISTFAHPAGSPERAAAEALRTAHDPPLPDYNGAIGDEQLAWLRAQLDAARAAGQRAVLFCHYPLLPRGGHSLWNCAAVLEALAPYGDVVAAWINGHNHAGAYARAHGIHFLTLKGMLDTTENSFATIEIFADGIAVHGHGREGDRWLELD